MEGLIPLVYKAIKGNKTRRKYRCLSQGYALAPHVDSHHHYLSFTSSPEKMAGYHVDRAGHRRHNSALEYPGEICSPERMTTGGVARLSKGDRGSRSLRVFSCISAA